MKNTSGVLLTDLYQLTMLQAYFERGMNGTAVFEFFVRTLPAERGFLMAAGLESALEFLETLRFDPQELDWLSRSGRFSRDFVDRVSALRFTGDVEAMPEGTIFFPPEPILRVAAPLPEAQLAETRLINLLHFQTLIASKAARFVLSAPGKFLVDFGLRRAHGAEAGLLAARSAFLAGMAGSSNVMAEFRYGIPSYGTMAHSFIQAHEDEAEAFLGFARVHPDRVTLLLDTYDTEAAAAKVVQLAPRFTKEGIRIHGVRLDSGNLGAHARNVRRILDEGGLNEATIFASGNLDERQVRELTSGGAPIDGFGIGSHLVTSADAPTLDCAYKLQEYAGSARRKRSEGKATWPGKKQVFRRVGSEGRFASDLLGLEGERQAGETLLHPVMRGGVREGPSGSLAEARRRAAEELARLPEGLRRLDDAAAYPVEISPALLALATEVDARGRA